MRLAISLLITLMTVATTVEAKTQRATKAPAATVNRFDGRLISYQQFVMLTPDKRRAYLKDLQKLLVMLESSQTKYEIASLDSTYWDMKKQIASFIQMAELLPVAEADTIGPIEQGPALPNGPRANVPVWNTVARKWVCYVPGFVFDTNVGTCVKTYESPNGGPQVDYVGDCPSGTRAARNPGVRSHRCVPEEAFAALSPRRQKEVEKGVRYPDDFFDKEDSDFGKDYVSGSGTHDIFGVPASTGPAEGSGITAGPRPSPAPAPAAPAAPAEPAAPAPAAPAPAPAPQLTCKLPELSCEKLSESQKTSLVGRFRNDRKSNACVAGGYFSSYKTAQKKAGTCKLEKSFRLTNPSANNKSGIVQTCGKDKESGKETAMCNPAVFCLGLKITDKVKQQMAAEQSKRLNREVKPEELDKLFKTVDGTDDKIQTITYCAPVSQKLTQSCADILEEHKAGKRGVAGYKGDGYEYVQCDPTKIKGFPLQDEWNKLAENTLNMYKSQCGADQSKAQFQALFCDECKIIGQHIFAMNQKAVGVGCTETAPTPGAAAPPADSNAIREEEGPG